MLDFCTRIERYIAGKSEDAYYSDTMLQDALVRNVELLGEASKQLLDVMPDAQSRFPAIPFDVLYLTRNRIINGYSFLKLRIIWEAAQREVPALREALLAAIGSLS